jgi:hypothetical protein
MICMTAFDPAWPPQHRGESWARMIGGALIVSCSLTQIGLMPLGLVLAMSGVLTALTGLIGKATSREEERNEAISWEKSIRQRYGVRLE